MLISILKLLSKRKTKIGIMAMYVSPSLESWLAVFSKNELCKKILLQIQVIVEQLDRPGPHNYHLHKCYIVC